MLKPPTRPLAYGNVVLRLRSISLGDATRQLVPYYVFIIVANGEDVGHISLRVGDTEHVRLYAGHIGYGVIDRHQGHGYAQQACRAIADFAFKLVGDIVITCNPENWASRRTIEALGAEFDAEYSVPPDDPIYLNGGRIKRRYVWRPERRADRE